MLIFQASLKKVEKPFKTKLLANCSVYNFDRQAAVGLGSIVCVQCCRMVDSVPIRHTISIL